MKIWFDCQRETLHLKRNDTDINSLVHLQTCLINKTHNAVNKKINKHSNLIYHLTFSKLTHPCLESFGLRSLD